MAGWLSNLFNRQSTIGDIIAESLRAEPEAWAQKRVLPFVWEYRNEKRDWTILLHSSPLGGNHVSFDQCNLTGRECRRIMRVIYRQADERRRQRRIDATRKASLRLVA